jgi:hypothetical protein
MTHATVVHPIGSVAAMELEKVVAINRQRALEREAGYVVVGLHGSVEAAVADAARLRAERKCNCRVEAVEERKCDHGPALVAIGGALAAARSNLATATGHGAPEDAERWGRQVASLEASVKVLWGVGGGNAMSRSSGLLAVPVELTDGKG